MAIIDRREIEFDEKALISVIAGSLQRAQAIGLPALRPTSIGFDPQANTMRVEYGTQPTVSLSSAHLGAFLVSYCVRARIPVPREPTRTSASNPALLSLPSIRILPTRLGPGDEAFRHCGKQPGIDGRPRPRPRPVPALPAGQRIDSPLKGADDGAERCIVGR